MTISQPITAVNIGNTGKTADVSDIGCRTQDQWAAVMAWHRKHPSAYWVGNPFYADRGRKFRCGFAHAYVNPDGTLCGVWVDENGRILEGGAGAVVGPTFKAEAFAVIDQFGEFRG